MEIVIFALCCVSGWVLSVPVIRTKRVIFG